MLRVITLKFRDIVLGRATLLKLFEVYFQLQADTFALVIYFNWENSFLHYTLMNIILKKWSNNVEKPRKKRPETFQFTSNPWPEQAIVRKNFIFFLTQKLFTEVNLQNTKCRQLSLQTTKYEKNTRIMP